MKPAKTVSEKVTVTLAALLFNILWLMVAVFILDWVHDAGWERRAFFFGVITAPLWEELAFRVIPIGIAKRFGEQYIMPVILLSSIIFGWGHGSGPISLMIQGVGGFILSLVYIKTNYNYWCVVALHAMWNFWAIFGTNL
ncbi:MAG TPA: CPBP family intramembrane glutamic endopeptidase [Chitinophagaceae bacterium]